MTDTPDEAERQAADELSRLGQEMRLDEKSEPAHLELYGISGTTDAIADGLDGEARWLLDMAGRCLRDAADIMRKDGPAPPSVSPVPEQGREESICMCQFGSTCNVCGPPVRAYTACWGPDVDQPEAGES